VAVREVQDLLEGSRESVCVEDIAVLEMSFRDAAVSTQKRAYFYYRAVAETLCKYVLLARESKVAVRAFSSLKSALFDAPPQARRAVTETLASLPLRIKGPHPHIPETARVSALGWDAFLKQRGIALKSAPVRFGRSLAAPLTDKGGLLVVKTAETPESVHGLHKEAAWISCLKPIAAGLAQRFDVPEIVECDGHVVFKLDKGPLATGSSGSFESAALAFRAHEDYFRYPNDLKSDRRMAPQTFLLVMARNAWLFGRLTGMGIVHEAPIPLFHNRVQAHRRDDNGRYQWQRGGRLDRWLESCRYPNFGMTGIRDFEHFTSLEGGGRRLHHLMGTQLLSLLLVVGSYFRSREGHRVGKDSSGKPVDARDLFDGVLMERVLRSIFESYYCGFVGEPLSWPPLFDLGGLTRRMVDEMGVDRHMEEILRVADQQAMSDEAFEAFLGERGYDLNGSYGLPRGQGDITMNTGPHLGGFNDRISIPEMIEAVGAISGLCVAGRYWKEKENGS